MTDASNLEIDSNGSYVATRCVPETPWLLLRHVAPFMVTHQLAQHTNMAASHRAMVAHYRLLADAQGSIWRMTRASVRSEHCISDPDAW